MIIRNLYLFIFVLISFLIIFSTKVSAHEGDYPIETINYNVKETKLIAADVYRIKVFVETLDGQTIPYLKASVLIVDNVTGSSENKDLVPIFNDRLYYGTDISLTHTNYHLYFHIEPPTFEREGVSKDSWLSIVEPDFSLAEASKINSTLEVGSKEINNMRIRVVLSKALPTYNLIRGISSKLSSTNSADLLTNVVNNANALVASSPSVNTEDQFILFKYAGAVAFGFVLGIIVFKSIKKRVQIKTVN